MSGGTVSVADWIKGVGFSLLASVIGASSKLAIRKSWLLEAHVEERPQGNFTPPCNPSFRDEPNTEVGQDALAFEPPDDDRDSVDRLDMIPGERRLSHLSFDGIHTTTQPGLSKAFTLRAMGMLGMTVFNPLCSVIAMNYASPSILAPFSGLTLVWIILFSPMVVHEQPSCRQVVACMFILVGEVVVAVFGDHTNDDGVTMDDVVSLSKLYSTRTHILVKKRSYAKVSFYGYCLGLLLWMCLTFHWMTSVKPPPYLKRFGWGVAGGSITGLQNFLKDALTVLKDNRDKVIPPFLFFVLLAGAIATAFGGLLILAACMKRYDTTFSAAMFVGSFVVSASIMSAIKYHTFSHLENLVDQFLYPIGLVLLIIGVLMLSNGDLQDDREVELGEEAHFEESYDSLQGGVHT